MRCRGCGGRCAEQGWWTSRCRLPSGYLVLVRTDKWYGSEKEWPIWSFVTRVHAGAIDRDLSLDTASAKISTDVVSNVQLGGVQLSVVLIMLCTRRALDCAARVVHRWAWKHEECCVMVIPCGTMQDLVY